MPYDPATIHGFFEEYGEQEWDRFGARPQDRVNLHVHNHYLRRFIEPGMQVLDAGAGPGRFTIEIARQGASVTVFDLSPAMLEQNRRRVSEAGFEQAVLSRDQGDVTDLSRYGDESFDAVVCFGGPLSYVVERADDALAELLRVARPNAPVLLSVMGTIGSTRAFLPGVAELFQRFGAERIGEVIERGHLTEELQGNKHVLKMYRWAELEGLLARHPCRLELASASNFLTTGQPEAATQALVADNAAWHALLEWELRCCREKGALDGGTHILAVVRKL